MDAPIFAEVLSDMPSETSIAPAAVALSLLSTVLIENVLRLSTVTLSAVAVVSLCPMLMATLPL